MLSSFHAGEVGDLGRLNRAAIVLLPKCTGATQPKDYRPISLQNWPMKVLSKILTSRLQRHISKLVDVDQTGFIQGRSITENFVCATELVQCRYKRKAPTIVLKLDFTQAFDSVS